MHNSRKPSSKRCMHGGFSLFVMSPEEKLKLERAKQQAKEKASTAYSNVSKRFSAGIEGAKQAYGKFQAGREFEATEKAEKERRKRAFLESRGLSASGGKKRKRSTKRRKSKSKSRRRMSKTLRSKKLSRRH